MNSTKLDVWGGEYEFDNLNITLHKSMGIDNPTIIAYGKNLLDLEQEQSILETYTSVFPFKKYSDDNNREQLITLPEILLDSTHLNKFTHRRILKVDFSSDENIKSVEQLRSKAKSYIKSNNVGVPKTNLKINYQDLSKVEGVFDNPALEQIDLCDRLKVYYNELGILNENAKVVKVIWDVILEENHEIEVGDSRSSFTDSTSAKLESLQVQNDSVLARINALVAEQEAAFDRFFKEKSKVIEDRVKGGYEKALLSSEEKIRKMGEAFDEKVNQFRNQVSATVEDYNRQFQATNLEISKNRVEATKQIQALTDRVNNIQDISNNETVRELRGLVNGATSKVTELETSITREFTAVKKKNEDSLNAVKAEFTKGVDGLTSKISSLEDYKNQDGSRTETLKQWVQRDTANQLSRERTEINKIIDNKGFVKNTEFSSKFNENAQGINRQLSALETYKNQDGTRIANMQIWAQNNTANQLTAERRNIEKWVNDKGYATTSVVENKVQETANSFSREISNVRNSIPTSIGGRNYIPNSNFAKELENWEMARLNNSGLNWQKGHAITNFGRGLHIWGTPNGEYKGLGTVPFNLTAKQGEKLTLSMDLGKDALTQNAILYIGLHYVVDNDIVSQQWQTLDLATQNFEVKKYKRISKTFTVSADMNRCRLMIHTQNNKLINFYIDNIKLEKGDISTDWTPAPEDIEQNVNELNTWKQTTNQTLNTVTSTLNDTVRHAQLRIGSDGIDFGSNKVFNGRNLASILSVSPESIQAITDRLVISPANENLVKHEYRDTFILNVRNGVLNRIYGSNADLVGEYQFKVAIIDFDTPTLNASIHVKYKDGTDSWFNSEFPTPSIVTLETSTSVKVQVELRKEIEYIEPLVFQNKWSDFYRFHLKKLFVGKKKSAELIVDGSIEGRHIKTNTLETGHHKAGSITSEIIAANAVRAKHVLIDDGLINNLVTHNAFISKLWAQDAFIRSLKTVKITSTQIDTETLRGKTITGATIDGGEIRGRTKIKLGEYGFMQPTSEGGLQINSPRRFNSKDGIGVQIIGATERGEDIPYGLFVYQDKDFTVGDRAVDTDSYIMTVQGFIRTKGINNLRFVNYRDASTSIGLWNRDVSLLFDNTDNDIYYSWKSKYSLWGIIKNFYNTTSDERLKKDIVTCDYKALDLINDFKFKSFNWKHHEEFGQKPYTEIGLIAQEVEEISENFVSMAGEYKTLNQFNLLTYSLKAIQELSTQNKELQNRISKLEEKING